MNRLKNRQFMSLIVILVSISLILLLKWTAPEKTTDIKSLPKVRVELFVVIARDVALGETLLGRLVPQRRAQLHFEVSGRIQSRLVEPGTRVSTGQIMLRLNDDDYSNLRDDAKARLLIERAGVKRDQKLLKLANQNHALQQKEVKRLQRLLQKSLVSHSKLDAARMQLSKLKLDEVQLQYNVNSSSARLDVRRSALAKAERNLQRSALTSPWPGVVNKVHVQIGDYVTPSKVAIEVIDDSVLEFMLTVQGSIARQLDRHSVIVVTVNGAKVKGTLVAQQIDPDPTTFTHEIRVRLPKNTGYPGQVVEAYISLPAFKNVMTIPVTALVYDDKKYFVMLYRQGQLIKKEIYLGVRVDNKQIVLDGLQVGDEIVSRDVASLSDDQTVAVTKQ